jgi:predicted regulator of Ras-like GTPase activity (Roadblock/LC7/MglB family)
MTRADRLAAALDDFLAVSPDVEGAAIVSPDGFPIASALPAHVEEDRLAAMSAALLILGERSASELGKGNLAQIFVEGPHGHVVIMAAGDSAVLVAVTSKSAKIGLVIFEMRQTAERIGSIMAADLGAEGYGAEAGIPATSLTGVSSHDEPTPTPGGEGDYIDIRDREARRADGP